MPIHSSSQTSAYINIWRVCYALDYGPLPQSFSYTYLGRPENVRCQQVPQVSFVAALGTTLLSTGDEEKAGITEHFSLNILFPE